MNGWAERPARSRDYAEIPTGSPRSPHKLKFAGTPEDKKSKEGYIKETSYILLIVYASIKNYKINHQS